jgi:mono/diheme cytochrome c family protein
MSRSRAKKRSTKQRPRRRRIHWSTVAVLLALPVIAGAVAWLGGRSTVASVRVPELTRTAVRGQMAFDESCASCHGAHGSGTDLGPPLIHDFYNPGHHGDDAFYAAVEGGVRQHHWQFGNMPAQPQVSELQTKRIIRYVRELQGANGITYRKHRMR